MSRQKKKQNSPHRNHASGGTCGGGGCSIVKPEKRERFKISISS